MSLAAKLLSASGGMDKLYVDDVFSAYTYTGKGSTQTITNGIDLAGKGGMVWTKSRSNAIANAIQDTLRGGNSVLQSDKTDQAQNLISNSFSSSGYALGSDYGNGLFNYNTYTYTSWAFRKASKFFDVITYTGNGVAGRQIPHTLGIAPGMLIVKCTNTGWDWRVYHCNLANTEYMVLNSTSAKATGATIWNSTAPTASEFTVGADSSVNGAGNTYVAYLFAHDPSADGIIQCGSYAGNGSATGPTVTLGWEPQFVLIKRSDSTQNWYMLDAMRGIPVPSSTSPALMANIVNAEIGSVSYVSANATGFSISTTDGGVNATGGTYIYLAIRRPNKPPTTGTEVYKGIARTGTGAAATVTGVGFAPDLINISSRTGTTGDGFVWHDRLRGVTELQSSSTGVEFTNANAFNGFDQNGYSMGGGVSQTNVSATTYINHFFRRAPGVFDQVCYTGTGVARTVPHSLGVAPELMIVKKRSAASTTGWYVYHKGLLETQVLFLNSASQVNGGFGNAWNSTRPASSVLSLGTNSDVNEVGATYVSYLFASLPGISKVGSYTGNGSSQTINCGFTTGARFILIKRTDSTGDWYIWDTVRGVVAGTDPHLSLNTTAAEVTTDDSIDPDTSGFIVNQLAATNINVSAATYIFLAFA